MPEYKNGDSVHVTIPPRMMWIIIVAILGSGAVGGIGTRLIDSKQAVSSTEDHEVFDRKILDLLHRINAMTKQIWILEGKIYDLDSRLNEATSNTERHVNNSTTRANRVQQQLDKLQEHVEQRHGAPVRQR